MRSPTWVQVFDIGASHILKCQDIMERPPKRNNSLTRLVRDMDLLQFGRESSELKKSVLEHRVCVEKKRKIEEIHCM